MNEPSLGKLIAIVGSDGAGKSTVGEALVAWLREQRPVAMYHLGKKTGDVGRALRRMPVVGGGIDRTLVGRAENARKAHGPDAITALVTYAISMRRVRKFKRMMATRRTGMTIIADRYPQVSVLGPKLDGPHFIVERPRSPIARLLARRERHFYEWMASYPPDLVIRLNVDLATAAARKPDHRYSSLAAKVAIVPTLSFGTAPIVEIDSTQPLATVLATAKRAIAETLGLARPAAS